MRPLLVALVLACLSQPPAPPAAADGALPYRIVFRYHSRGPSSINDYEAEVTVFERQPGGEKRLGTFRGSIFPDDLSKWGRIKDGTYDLYLGLHRRSQDGKPLVPSKADLVVKSKGWLRPAMIVNADGPVPVLSDNPRKKVSRLIHVHNGYNSKRWSEGCLTIVPAHWSPFISIFLDRYRTLEDWHRDGRYVGRKVAVLEVRPR